jgi:hypothetical protein
MDKLSSNVGNSKIGDVRTFFLRGFFGQKLLDPLPRCPIESMFWDWEFSYYPDNDMASGRYYVRFMVRFAVFSREYVTFLLDHKRFVSDYADWIQQNEANLITIAIAAHNDKVTPLDVKVYADIYMQILRERLNYVLLVPPSLGEEQARVSRVRFVYSQWQISTIS